jgi:hypothetical protein
MPESTIKVNGRRYTFAASLIEVQRLQGAGLHEVPKIIGEIPELEVSRDHGGILQYLDDQVNTYARVAIEPGTAFAIQITPSGEPNDWAIRFSVEGVDPITGQPAVYGLPAVEPVQNYLWLSNEKYQPNRGQSSLPAILYGWYTGQGQRQFVWVPKGHPGSVKEHMLPPEWIPLVDNKISVMLFRKRHVLGGTAAAGAVIDSRIDPDPWFHYGPYEREPLFTFTWDLSPKAVIVDSDPFSGIPMA